MTSYWSPELGSGQVESDPEKPIIHFGSPTPKKPEIVIVDRHGRERS